MALLVGLDTTASNKIYDNSRELLYHIGYYTGVLTGTATTAHIRIQGNLTASEVKVCIYNSSGSLLAISDPIDIVTGDQSATISVSITQNTNYIMGFIANGYFYFYCDSNSWSCESDTTGSYSSPPESIGYSEGGSFNFGRPAIWLDGTSSISIPHNRTLLGPLYGPLF